MAPADNPNRTNWWVPVWELVVHVGIGSLLFAVIVVPAVALDLTVSWMQRQLDPSAFLIYLLTGVKYVIASGDVALYLIFMISMSRKFVRDIWKLGGKHVD